MENGEGGDVPRNKASPEFPPKKLGRQLDFTSYGGASAAAVALPEHPQQPKPTPPTVPPPKPQPQLQLQPRPQIQSQQHGQMLFMPTQQPQAPPHLSLRPL
ncbi:unnamed protein product [Ilex paraguariensis]|uniref:Uncharacterized protein n=1 Tax=Ilex paraguariensis TaxID=185542 RepID=A0ABC8TTF4_9AQUA